MPMKPSTWLRRLAMVAVVGLLAACAGIPRNVEMGTPRADIEKRLGRPTSVHTLPDGTTRLQYSYQPAGQQVYNLDLDATGRLRRTEQMMDADLLLQRIQVDRWTRDDVRVSLGKPALVERVMSFDGEIWTYRLLEATRPRQVHVHIDPAGVVRRVMLTDEPMPADDSDGKP